jgi:DNA-binding ferritin-like protein
MLLRLRDQSHLIHLNYDGKDFIVIHGYLKERYEEHQDQFDTVAEFVRVHGAKLPETVSELRNAAPMAEDKGCPFVYRDNINILCKAAMNLESIATCNCAIDVANYMAELCASAGKIAWFLNMTLGECEQQ